MKSAETIKKNMGVLHSEEINKITFVIEELTKLKNNKSINEENLRVYSTATGN